MYQDWTNCAHIGEEKDMPLRSYSRSGAEIHEDWINRAHMKEEKDMPQPKTFTMGLDFLEMNKEHDNWFLQIETFDPHEPYDPPSVWEYSDHDCPYNPGYEGKT